MFIAWASKGNTQAVKQTLFFVWHKSPSGIFSPCTRYKSMLKKISALKQSTWLPVRGKQSHLSSLFKTQ